MLTKAKKLSIFKKVVKGLLKQNRKSVESIESCGYGSPNCQYRGKDGAKCAIGLLIKDKFYTPSIEQKGIMHADVSKTLINSGIPISENSDINFLRELQIIHDDYKPEDWMYEFTKMATDYFVLTVGEVNTLMNSLKPKKRK